MVRTVSGEQFFITISEYVCKLALFDDIFAHSQSEKFVIKTTNYITQEDYYLLLL